MSGYKGQANSVDVNSDFNSTVFIVRQILKELNTSTLVKIVKCTNSGGLSPVGMVNVLPLVNLLDGNGNATHHETVYNCLYFRLQGGTNAVIIDPEPGDIGICCFADRDISSVKKNKGQSNPGSGRRFDFADGLYIGGVLNGTPSQYVRFSSSGIELKSPTEIILDAPGVTITSQNININATIGITINTPQIDIIGNMGITGNILNNEKNIGSDHVHSGVDSGPNYTGYPI